MSATNVIQRECIHPSGISIINAQEIDDSWVGMSVTTNVDPGNKKVFEGVQVSVFV